jgi:hypothetical protein
LLFGIVSLSRAAETPPVRPGLWEVSASGPSITDRIKNTPPDKRQSMEQVAGISIRGDTIVRRVCITQEMLAAGISNKNRPDCDFKQTWKGKNTKITFQCPNGSQGRGELTYATKESFKGWMDSERSEKPRSNQTQTKPELEKKTIRVMHSGKWMAKDCAAKNN